MSGRPKDVVLLLALCGLASTAACDDRAGLGEGTGTVAAQLTGSALRDEVRSLRVLAFNLAVQGCTGPRVGRPDLPPLATSGLVRADLLQVTLTIPAGPRTIYVEVYRDAEGTDRFGTGCAEVVLAAAERRTLRIEVVTDGSDADGDADTDDGAGDVDAEVLDDGPLDADDAPADDVPPALLEQTPAVALPPRGPYEPVWYYEQSGESVGPVSQQDIRMLLRNGLITRGTLVWTEGMAQWTPLSEVQEFRPEARP